MFFLEENFRLFLSEQILMFLFLFLYFLISFNVFWFVDILLDVLCFRVR